MASRRALFERETWTQRCVRPKIILAVPRNGSVPLSRE
jgi:hypothetical protein